MLPGTCSTEIRKKSCSDRFLCSQEQGTEHFMGKWITAEKFRAELRHAVVCPNVTGRTKDGIAQQAGSCWFARPCRLATSGANLYPPGVGFADVMTSFSGVTFVLLSRGPSFNRSPKCRSPDSHTCFFFYFGLFGDVAFSVAVCSLYCLLYGEYVVRFSFRMVFS